MKKSDIFYYGLYLFFPIVPFIFILSIGVFLSILASLALQDSFFLQMLLYIIILLAGALAVSAVAYYLCTKYPTFVLRLFINYAAWLFIGIGTIYLCMAGIGGASMAVVDGAVSGRQFREQTFVATFSILSFAHIIIVPWCLFVTYRTTHLFHTDSNKNLDQA